MLSCDNLTCIRGGRTVFENLSLSLNKGESLLVTGPNGAGKTSLLRLLAGLLPPHEAVQPGNTHFIGGKTAVKTHLTVEENLESWCDLLNDHNVKDVSLTAHSCASRNPPMKRDPCFRRGERRGNCDAALNFWDLLSLKDMRAGFLSAGQRQRLALCRLLAIPKKLWLLDEPFNALDADNRTRLAKLLRRHLNEGGMAVIATHDKDNVETLGASEIRLGT